MRRADGRTEQFARSLRWRIRYGLFYPDGSRVIRSKMTGRRADATLLRGEASRLERLTRTATATQQDLGHFLRMGLVSISRDAQRPGFEALAPSCIELHNVALRRTCLGFCRLSWWNGTGLATRRSPTGAERVQATRPLRGTIAGAPVFQGLWRDRRNGRRGFDSRDH